MLASNCQFLYSCHQHDGNAKLPTARAKSFTSSPTTQQPRRRWALTYARHKRWYQDGCRRKTKERNVKWHPRMSHVLIFLFFWDSTHQTSVLPSSIVLLTRRYLVIQTSFCNFLTLCGFGASVFSPSLSWHSTGATTSKLANVSQRHYGENVSYFNGLLTKASPSSRCRAQVHVAHYWWSADHQLSPGWVQRPHKRSQGKSLYLEWRCVGAPKQPAAKM